MDQTNVLMKPLITEKSMDEAGRGRFTFAVSRTATKTQIRKAIEEQFGVNVVAIQTSIMKGKTRRMGKRRTTFMTSPYKKTIVGLKSGQRIDLFEVPQTEPAKTKEKEK